MATAVGGDRPPARRPPSVDGDGTVTLGTRCWKVEAGESLDSCDRRTCRSKAIRGDEAIEDLQRRSRPHSTTSSSVCSPSSGVRRRVVLQPDRHDDRLDADVLRAVSRGGDRGPAGEDRGRLRRGSVPVHRSTPRTWSTTTRCLVTARRRTRAGSGPHGRVLRRGQRRHGDRLLPGARREGSIEAQDVPVPAVPRCGLAELWWSGDYSRCPTTTSSPSHRRRTVLRGPRLPASSRTGNCRSSWRHRNASTVGTSTTSTTTSTSRRSASVPTAVAVHG